MNTVEPIRDMDDIQEVKKYLKKRSVRDYILFVLGIHIGLRISDILQLRVKDVKGTHIKITEKKTGKPRRSKIPRSIQDVIKEYISGMNDEEYLFQSRKGFNQPIQRVQAYKIISQAAAQIGLSESGTHTMRKTFGYHFYKKTKDIAMLQKHFNHHSPSVTLRYIGIDQDWMDKALDDFAL
jgi:integrase